MNLVLPTLLAASAVAISVFGGTPSRQAEEAAMPQVEGSGEWNADLAWVDPVITGPVSDKFRRVREEAGCDEATWPNIPKVCFPD